MEKSMLACLSNHTHQYQRYFNQFATKLKYKKQKGEKKRVLKGFLPDRCTKMGINFHKYENKFTKKKITTHLCLIKNQFDVFSADYTQFSA